MKPSRQIAGVAILTAVFGAGGWYMMQSAPKSERRPPKAQTVVVNAKPIIATDHAVRIEGFGVVAPAVLLDLQTQVSGRVIAVHKDLEPGGFIEAGETVLRLDRSDLLLALEEAEATLERAKANVAIEEGRQVIAEAELAIVTDAGDIELDDASRSLALREPQKKQMEAELRSAQNAVARARLNLSRAKLSYDRDIVIIDADVRPGEILQSGQVAGQAADAERYWFEVRLPSDKLFRLMALEETPQARVTLNGQQDELTGNVVRYRPELSDDSRLGGVIIEIPEPFAQTEQGWKPRVILGAYGKASITAGLLENVVAIPRSARADNNFVYVADGDNRLEKRAIDVVWEAGEEILVANRFEPADRLVTSRVSGLTPGIVVDVKDVDAKQSAPEPAQVSAVPIDGAIQ